MRYLWMGVLLPMFLLLICCRLEAAEIANLECTDLNGRNLSLASLAGDQPCLLMCLWDIDCPSSIQALPAVSALHLKYEKAGLATCLVSFYGGDTDRIKSFLSENTYRMHALIGNSDIAVCELGVDEFPYVILFNREREIIYIHIGMTGNLEEQIGEMINACLEGLDLPVHEVKPKCGGEGP